jgi:hypothetical protein
VKTPAPNDRECKTARDMVNVAMTAFHVQKTVALSPRLKIELGTQIANLTEYYATMLAIARVNGKRRQA